MLSISDHALSRCLFYGAFAKVFKMPQGGVNMLSDRFLTRECDINKHFTCHHFSIDPDKRPLIYPKFINISYPIPT